MDNRFKVLTLDSPPSDTADALTELRSKGLIKAFFEVTAAGRRVFTVEYP